MAELSDAKRAQLREVFRAARLDEFDTDKRAVEVRRLRRVLDSWADRAESAPDRSIRLSAEEIRREVRR